MTNYRIVAAYDFTAAAEVALLEALELACKTPGCALHFVTVVGAGEGVWTADRIAHDVRDHVRLVVKARGWRDDLELFVHTPIGEPEAEILRLADELHADVLVVGCRGRGALGRILLGSVSEGVLHGAHCPVLIARPKVPVELPKVAEAVALH
jgi:nucleotide-binding universal stress UspA family protein